MTCRSYNTLVGLSVIKRRDANKRSGAVYTHYHNTRGDTCNEKLPRVRRRSRRCEMISVSRGFAGRRGFAPTRRPRHVIICMLLPRRPRPGFSSPPVLISFSNRAETRLVRTGTYSDAHTTPIRRIHAARVTCT